jgi:hypothetical protein
MATIGREADAGVRAVSRIAVKRLVCIHEC